MRVPSTAILTLAVLVLGAEQGCVRTSGSLWPEYSGDTAPDIYRFRNLATTISSIYVAGDGMRIWAVGGRGTISESADGVHWNLMDSGRTTFLHAVCGVGNGARLWAVGNGGVILHSTDGKSWKAAASPTKENLLSIFAAADGSRIWASGRRGTIVESRDGETWTLEASGTDKDLLSIFGPGNGQEAWAVGQDGAIVRTNDGEHWEKQESGTDGDLESGFTTRDGRRAWVVGGAVGGTIQPIAGGLQGYSRKSIILECRDGVHWKTVDNSFKQDLFAVFGMADGSRLWAAGDEGAILYSRDGEHWSATASGTSSALYAISGSNDGQRLIAAGRSGAIVQSLDGERWQTSNDGTTNDLHAGFATPDGKRVWFLGDTGTVLESNEGEQWRKHQTIGEVWGEVTSVIGTSDGSKLWVTDGRFPGVWESADGEHWTSKGGSGSNGFLAVFATSDGRRAWAVGPMGTVMTSSDGGPWVPQSTGSENQLLWIFGTGDGRRLWAVGTKGTILESRDGDHWEAAQVLTTQSLYAVYCTADGQRAWAVGDKGAILELGQDHHWRVRYSGTESRLLSVFASADGRRIWAVGEKGTMLESSDGENWATRASGTTERLTAVTGTSDGKRLWVGGTRGTLLVPLATGKAPYIDKVRLSANPLELELQLESARGGEKISAIAVNEYDYAKGATGDWADAVGCTSNTESKRWTCRFNPSRLQPGVAPPGSMSRPKVHAKIRVDREGGNDVYDFEALYDPWSPIRDNQVRISLGGAAVLLIGLPTLLLWVRPLWNVRLYQALKLSQLEKLDLPGVGGAAHAVLRLVTVLPWFISRRRTLDAWTSEKQECVAQLWHEDGVGAGSDGDGRGPAKARYVPLPVRRNDPFSGPQIPQPTAEDIRGLIANTRTVIQIVGPGGAGKTTLARRIGDWALENGRKAGIGGHPMLPIWIDEDLDAARKTLKDVVRGRLNAALPEERIDDVLFSALLEKQYLAVFMDRLSERSAATREHIEMLYRSARIGLLVLTSREVHRIDGVRPERIYPQPLNSATLLRFMTELLDGLLAGEGSERPFGTIREQCLLGEKLAELIQLRTQTDEADVPLSPLPVKLFVEQAVDAVRSGNGLDHLPASLPEVYFRYLRRVNPQDPNVAHFVENDRMIKIAKILGKTALDGDFIPKEFTREAAVAALSAAGELVIAASDPIERLRLNGILNKKEGGLTGRLRFVLDPVAEFLAAAEWGQECGHDTEKWERVLADAKPAPGFQLAAKLVRQAYWHV